MGGGVKPECEVNWILSFILGDPDGEQLAQRIDSTIARLPGMEWFNCLMRCREEALNALASSNDLLVGKSRVELERFSAA